MQNEVQAQGWPTATAASAPPSTPYLQASLAVAAPCRRLTNSLRLWRVAAAKAWGMQVVHLIRHGESEFNAAASSSKSWEDPQIYNPNLTVKGQAQVSNMRTAPLNPQP